MAKKKTTRRSSRKAGTGVPENALPQNIVPFGERVEENKNIYISQKVYKEIHRFTKDKTTNESGGMLIGTVIEELGKTNIVINGFIEAKHCEGTPTTLTFTHETWEYVHKEMAKKFPEQKIVGWIHTHPDFGIFLSEYDKFIQENFFKEDYQIAYVVDPIQGIEGFYFWIDQRIERCKGFYVFDKNGVKITVNDTDRDDESEGGTSEGVFSFRNILLGLLSVATVLLVFMNLSLSSRLEKMERQYQDMAQAINQHAGVLTQQQQQIQALGRQYMSVTPSAAPAPTQEPAPAEQTPDNAAATPAAQTPAATPADSAVPAEGNGPAGE